VEKKKIFLTEFYHEGTPYEGPRIIAGDFFDAEQKAKEYDCSVVGVLDIIVDEDDFSMDFKVEQWNRVLH